MLQNPRKTLGFKKNMVYKIPPGGGGGGGRLTISSQWPNTINLNFCILIFDNMVYIYYCTHRYFIIQVLKSGLMLSS